jgi:hypothetical protein
MPKTLLVLIVATLPFAAQRDMERRIVDLWIENARHHEPGTIDGPLSLRFQKTRAGVRTPTSITSGHSRSTPTNSWPRYARW